MDVCRLSKARAAEACSKSPDPKGVRSNSDLWSQCSWPGEHPALRALSGISCHVNFVIIAGPGPGTPPLGTPPPVAGVIDFPIGGQEPLAGVDLPVFLILLAC